MIDEEQVKNIIKKVLDEEHLIDFIKIFEKEHNLFRGSHDKIALPEKLEVPQTIVNQIVEKFETGLTEGSIPFIDENGHFTEDKDELFYDEEKKIFCLGLNNPETDMVRGYCMKEGTPPTQNIVDTIQAYAMDTPLERLTDGGLEVWDSGTNLTYWTEFTDGLGTHEQEASEVHSGTYSMKLTTTAQGEFCGFYEEFILTPGNNCKVTVWYLKPAHESSGLRLYIQTGPSWLTYLTPAGIWKDTDYDLIYLPTTEVWKKFELEFKAHPDYSNYRIRFYKSHGPGGAVSYYLDDVSVSENRNVVPYFRTEAGLIIGLNQDLRTSASVRYAGLTLTGFSGVLKAVDGVVTEAADHADLANITANQHHAQAHTLASHSTKPHSALTDVGVNQHHAQLHGSSHHSGGGDAIKLDDLASPDDNTDLNALTTKHGLLPKLGGGTTNFLRADGAWAAPAGGNGATTFLGLTDTPANYVGSASKIVKVNATPDALEFGADISDLEDVDTIVGQAGKYAKVKVGDAGIEWVAGTGGGAAAFLELTDTPSAYTLKKGYVPVVNDAEDALVFVHSKDLPPKKIIDDPPDDEFEAAALDGKWAVVDGAPGVVDLIGVAGDIYDLSSRRGHLLVQAINGQEFSIRQDYTLADGKSIILAVSAAVTCDGLPGVANNEIMVKLSLNDNDGAHEAGNFVTLSIDTQTDGMRILYYKTGTYYGTSNVANDLTHLGQKFYLRILRDGTTYYGFFSLDCETWVSVYKHVHGGALTNIWITVDSAAAVGTPVPIQAFDWIRLGDDKVCPW